MFYLSRDAYLDDIRQIPIIHSWKVKIWLETHLSNRPDPCCVTLSPHFSGKSRLIRTFHSLFTFKLSRSNFTDPLFSSSFHQTVLVRSPFYTRVRTDLELVSTKRCDLSSRLFSLRDVFFFLPVSKKRNTPRPDEGGSFSTLFFVLSILFN